MCRLTGSNMIRTLVLSIAVKFCKELIKDGADADVFGILSCLQTNRPKISKDCNEVLASHGQ